MVSIASAISPQSKHLPTDDFAIWYAGAWPRLSTAIAPIVGGQAEAEDIASQAFAMAFERWARLRDPSAWVYRVAINLTKQRWGRARREGTASTRWLEPPVSLPEVSPELWRAVGALPHQQRVAVALRYVLDLPQGEVAAYIGCFTGYCSGDASCRSSPSSGGSLCR